MGRRAQATNGQENGHSQERPAEPGHNGPTTEQLLKYALELTSAERLKDEAVAGIRVLRKQMKEAGIDLKRFDLVRKQRGYTEAELREQLNTHIRYAQAMRVPVYSKLQEIEAREPTEEENLQLARDRGLTSGELGEGPDKNPWDLTTPMGQAFADAQKQGKDNLLNRVGRG